VEGNGKWVRLWVIRLVHPGLESRSRGDRACVCVYYYGEDGCLVLVVGNGLPKGTASLRHEQRRGKLGDRGMANDNYLGMGVGVCCPRVTEGSE